MYGAYSHSSVLSTEQRIEEAKNKTQAVKRSLTNVIQNAKHHIGSLTEEKTECAEEIAAAKQRYDDVENATKRICNDCWTILPALGRTFDKRTLAKNFPDCGLCGMPLYPKRHKRDVEMPPRGVQILQDSIMALSAAEAVTKGHHGTQSLASNTMVQASWNPIAVQSSSYGHSSSFYQQSYYNGYPEPDNAWMKKSVAVEIARKKLDTVQEKQRKISLAIPEWEKYRSQHKDQLQKIEETQQTLEEKERGILEERLDKLDGGKRNCPLCKAKPKEVAFQCGHQSCTNCSKRVRKCHTCNEKITKKIKLC